MCCSMLFDTIERKLAVMGKTNMEAKSYTCAVEATLVLIGGKWKILILWHLLSGTKRFGELQSLLQRITQKMLTLNLRELERDGVIHREIYKEIPPKVEYSLTDFGVSLTPVLQLLDRWGLEHAQQLGVVRQT